MSYTDELPNGTLRDFWEQRVAATPDNEFAIYEDRSWTYAEFDAWVERLANGLADAGVGEGTHVAMLVPSGIELLRLEWALIKLGAVWVPAIPGSTYEEARFVIEHSRAQFVVTDVEHWEMLSAGGGLDPELQVYLADGERPGAAGLDSVESSRLGVEPLTETDGESMAMIMYTSGSTGRPKGVMVKSCAYPRLAHFMGERMGTTAEDRWYCNLPLFHGAAFMAVFPAIAAGAALFVRSKFSRSAYLEDIRRHDLTAGFLMPAMAAMVLTREPEEGDAENTMRIIYGHVRNEEFSRRFGVEILTVWCSTETLGAGAMASPGYDPARPADVIGPILPEDAEIKVIDQDGVELGPEEPGEFIVRHPNALLGYYRDSENTAATLRDGWIHTGDLGAIRPQGDVRFMGRVKNMIKRGGENIAGEEVELTIADHPAVDGCVVCGVPDPIRTEEVFATVALRPGAEASEAELAAWCGERLSDWKVPRYLKLVEGELPRLPNDKLDRRRISGAADPALAWDRQERSAETPAPTGGR